LLQRSGQLEVNGLRVAGQPVGLGPNGVDDKALNDVLRHAGLSVRIDHQENDPHGASADVLEITVSHPLPEGTSNGVLRYRFGGSGASTTKDQLSYLASGGLGGLFCLGAGVGLLISAGLSDEWRKLDALTRAVRHAAAQDPSVPPFPVVPDVYDDTFSDKQL